MAGPRFKNSVFGEQVKKKPRVKMSSTGRAVEGEKTPIVQGELPKKKKKEKKRVKIVPGFKGLIKERQKIIN